MEPTPFFDARVLAADGHVLCTYERVGVCSHGERGALTHLRTDGGQRVAPRASVPHTVQVRCCGQVMVCLLLEQARGGEWWQQDAGTRAHLALEPRSPAERRSAPSDVVVLCARARQLHTDVVVVCRVQPASDSASDSDSEDPREDAADPPLLGVPQCHVLIPRAVLVDMASECRMKAHYTRRLHEQRRTPAGAGPGLDAKRRRVAAPT